MIDLLWLPLTIPLGLIVATIVLERLERFAIRTIGSRAGAVFDQLAAHNRGRREEPCSTRVFQRVEDVAASCEPFRCGPDDAGTLPPGPGSMLVVKSPGESGELRA